MDIVRYQNGRGGMPTLMGRDPFRLLSDLIAPVTGAASWVAPLAYHEDEDGFTVTVDVPGVAEQDLDVTVSAAGLSVSGKREGRGEFHHELRLPESVDPQQTEARLDSGVLTIRLGRRPETKPRKIAIQGGASEQPALDAKSE